MVILRVYVSGVMVPKLVLFKSHYLEGQSLFALSLFVGKTACITLLVNMLVGFPLANWFWDNIHWKIPDVDVIPPHFPT